MTYAKAVAALVEFAQNVSADNDADCNGWATPARAALATWRVRPRLRDDDKAVAAIALWLVAVGVPDRDVFPRARGIADALETALFGTGPHPGGEPAKEKSDAGHGRFDCKDCGQGVAADEDGCCATCGRGCIAVYTDGTTVDHDDAGGEQGKGGDRGQG